MRITCHRDIRQVIEPAFTYRKAIGVKYENVRCAKLNGAKCSIERRRVIVAQDPNLVFVDREVDDL